MNEYDNVFAHVKVVASRNERNGTGAHVQACVYECIHVYINLFAYTRIGLRRKQIQQNVEGWI